MTRFWEGGRQPPSKLIPPEEFISAFLSKSLSAHLSTEDADPPIYSQASEDAVFSQFQNVSLSDVTRAIYRLNNKSSPCDTLPTPLLKCCVDILSPYITFLFNRSLDSGHFPSVWKKVKISPILKKSSADSHDPSSYRPISNLPVLSKVLERFVCRQLGSYIDEHDLRSRLQSAYRLHHSTETTLLKVMSDLFTSFDKGQISLLSFLDLSSAFDCVDHVLLSNRLRHSVGLRDSALKWFESFLNGRTISVSDGQNSSSSALVCGVPQGSVLGPALFSLFITDIVPLVHEYGHQVHLFADDILIYGSSSAKDSSRLSSSIATCVEAVANWLRSNRLILNMSKTQFMWCHSKRRRVSECLNTPIRLCNTDFIPVNSVRYLGVILDSSLSLVNNVTRTTSTCFSALRRIRSIRRSLTRPLLETLVTSLVLSRLDYCIGAYYGVTSSQLWRLQRVLHAAARLIFRSRRYDRITPLLQELQWLSVEDRITHRLGSLTFACCRGRAPSYLSDLLTASRSVPGRRSLRSASSGALVVPRVRHPTLGGRSFVASASRVWNSLSQSLTSLHDPSVFKTHLKRELLSQNAL